MNTEELKAVYPLHRCLVDGDGCVFSALSPEIHHLLLGLVDVERELVLLTPFCQGTHLLSVAEHVSGVERSLNTLSTARSDQNAPLVIC